MKEQIMHSKMLQSGLASTRSAALENNLDYKYFLDTFFADASEQIRSEKTFEFESKQH